MVRGGPFDPSSILLQDRVAVITGAGQGVGEAIALLFARFGARLAVCDRVPETLETTSAQLSEIGRPVLSRLMDVRDNDAVASFTHDIEQEYGRVDILINNAGGTFYAQFMDVNTRGEQTLIAENFTQVTAMIRGCVPLMHDGGSIVNHTSIEAHQGAPGFAIYSAMKAAVANLTCTLALELAPRKIRVNAIATDAVATGGEMSVRAELQAAGARYEPSSVPPLGYFAPAEEAASVALFLAGDLSRFVTGSTVHVDGGAWASGGWRPTDREPHP